MKILHYRDSFESSNSYFSSAMFNHLKWKLIYAHKILLSQNDIFRLKMTNFRSKISISKKSTKIHSRPEFSDFFSNWVCIQLSNIACGISNIHKLLWTDIISYNIIFRHDLKKVSSFKFTSSFSFADWSANQKVKLTVSGNFSITAPVFLLKLIIFGLNFGTAVNYDWSVMRVTWFPVWA